MLGASGAELGNCRTWVGTRWHGPKRASSMLQFLPVAPSKGAPHQGASMKPTSPSPLLRSCTPKPKATKPPLR